MTEEMAKVLLLACCSRRAHEAATPDLILRLWLPDRVLHERSLLAFSFPKEIRVCFGLMLSDLFARGPTSRTCRFERPGTIHVAKQRGGLQFTVQVNLVRRRSRILAPKSQTCFAGQ
jgi:hypothetical protein